LPKTQLFSTKTRFVDIYSQTIFLFKQTLARIDYLRADGHLVTKKALTMLKFALIILHTTNHKQLRA